jgi:cell division protein DivIC
MKTWYNNLITNYPFLKFIGNRYTIVLVFFIVWMLFLDNTSYIEHRVLNKQIDELEDNKSYYQNEINKDNKSIKNLKNPSQVERYAREKYYMKRDSEDIYIVEYEEDELRKNYQFKVASLLGILVRVIPAFCCNLFLTLTEFETLSELKKGFSLQSGLNSKLFE